MHWNIALSLKQVRRLCIPFLVDSFHKTFWQAMCKYWWGLRFFLFSFLFYYGYLPFIYLKSNNSISLVFNLKYTLTFGLKFENKRLEQNSAFQEAWCKLWKILEIRCYNNIFLWFSKSYWIKQETPNIFNSTNSKIWYLFIIFLTNKTS